jgi:hypothetical protein
VTTFTDDFNRADGSPGANWTAISGTWTIASNQLSSGNAGGTIAIRATGAMATNDNSAQVTIAATAAVSHGVFCRGNPGFTQGYLWRNDGTSWVLFSNVGGSFTSIGSFAGAAVAGDVAKVQAVGSTIKGLVNGIERVSVTNTAVTTGTSVGIRAESTNLLKFDDFTGTDVTSGATGDAALAATATRSATGLRAATGVAASSSTATLSASGLRAAAGDAAQAVAAGLSAAGPAGLAGAASLAGTATLSTTGVRAASSDGVAVATAGLSAAGSVAHSGDAAFAVSAGLSALSVPQALGDAALAASASVSAAGIRRRPATARRPRRLC